MLAFVSSPLVYMPDPSTCFTFKYVVTGVRVGGSGKQISQ